MSSAERYGLSVLLDLSRVCPVDDQEAPVVRLVIESEPATDLDDVGRLVAAGWGIRVGEGTVHVPRRALAWVTEIAGAGAEQRSDRRDRFGRVPSEESVSVRAGLERRPIVSEAGTRLRDAVVAAAGRRPVRIVEPWPEGRSWAAAVTHDLDVVAAWPVFTALRLAELLRKGKLGLASRVAAAALRSATAAPVRAAVAEIVEAERRHGVPSTWFIICGTPTVRSFLSGDVTYLPESPRARAIIGEVAAAGHELGLHGSFETGDDVSAFARQRARLSQVIGVQPVGVRQHFLRARPGPTQRGMREAGFGYDATYGFADRNGFRLGVADVVQGWDEAAGSPTDLDEVALVWMDRALSKYGGIEDPIVWIEDALELAARARDHEGLWVGLWHPNLSPALGYPGAPESFERLLRALGEHEPWWATLARITSWRRARRSVRIRGVEPGGHVEAVAEDSPWPIRLRDGQGASREAVSRE